MKPHHEPPLPSFRSSFVLLWSPRQQCFHCETVEEMLRENWNSFFYQGYHDTDWVVVGFADTRQELIELQQSMTSSFDDPAPGDIESIPSDL